MVQELIEEYLCNFFAEIEGDKSLYGIRMMSDGVVQNDGTGRHKISYTLVKEHEQEQDNHEPFAVVRELRLLQDIMKLKDDWMLNRNVMVDLFITQHLISLAEQFQVPVTDMEIYFKTDPTGTMFMIIGYYKNMQLMATEGKQWQMTLEELTQGM